MSNYVKFFLLYRTLRRLSLDSMPNREIHRVLEYIYTDCPSVRTIARFKSSLLVLFVEKRSATGKQLVDSLRSGGGHCLTYRHRATKFIQEKIYGE
jgi:hypothetical protein